MMCNAISMCFAQCIFLLSNSNPFSWIFTIGDSNHDVMNAFSDKGFLTKNSPLGVAEESDAVITMLPSSAHVSFKSTSS